MVSQYVLMSSPFWDLWPDITSCRKVAVRKLQSCFCGAPSLTRGRVCSLQCNRSIVRIAQNVTLLSHLRLPEPEGPGSPYLYPPGTGMAQLLGPSLVYITRTNGTGIGSVICIWFMLVIYRVLCWFWCPLVGTSPLDWGHLSSFSTQDWNRAQSPKRRLKWNGVTNNINKGGNCIRLVYDGVDRIRLARDFA
jgi:hypothetical protein